MTVGFNTFTKKEFSVSFTVKNLSNRYIKIFSSRIPPNTQLDLMSIPYVSEADIKHSLLKGQLFQLFSSGQVSLIKSTIDLNSFSSDFIDFLTNVLGVDIGVIEAAGNITLINGDPGPSVSLDADDIPATGSRLWLNQTQSTQINTSNTHTNTIGNPHATTASDVGAIPNTEKGAANGVATLDGSSKIPSNQLPATPVSFQGTWDANTNTPTLVDGTGTNGDFYYVYVAGTTSLDGNSSWNVGDQVLFSSSAGAWLQIGRDDLVTSVNSQIGAVVLDSDDISEGSTNLYVSSAQRNALAGTTGTPNTGNEFVTNTDTRLTDARTPTGSAGGNLTGTYPNPTVDTVQLLHDELTGAGTNTHAQIDSHIANSTTHVTSDEKNALTGTSGTPNVSNKFVTNSDSRLTDSRTPTGSAGGNLTGTYPNPTVDTSQLLHGDLTGAGTNTHAQIDSHIANSTIHVTSDEKNALAGTSGTPNASNKFVTNSDSRLTDSRAPTGSAGGNLSGTYPNPTVVSLTLGSDAQGDIYYRGASSLARLPAGNVGQILSSGGAGANVSWSSGMRKVASLTPSGGVLTYNNSLLNSAIRAIIVYNVIPTASSSIPWLRLNNDSSAVYARSTNRNSTNQVLQSATQYTLSGSTTASLTTTQRAYGRIELNQFGGGVIQIVQNGGIHGANAAATITRVTGSGAYFPSPTTALSQINILMSATTLAATSTLDVWISS